MWPLLFSICLGYETDSDSDDSGLTDHTFQAEEDDSDSGESFMTSAGRDRLGIFHMKIYWLGVLLLIGHLTVMFYLVLGGKAVILLKFSDGPAVIFFLLMHCRKRPVIPCTSSL